MGNQLRQHFANVTQSAGETFRWRGKRYDIEKTSSQATNQTSGLQHRIET